MENFLFILLAACLLAAPGVIHGVIRMRRNKKNSGKEGTQWVFVCPACGREIYATASQLLYGRTDKAVLKCPSCGRRELCKQKEEPKTDGETEGGEEK